MKKNLLLCAVLCASLVLAACSKPAANNSNAPANANANKAGGNTNGAPVAKKETKVPAEKAAPVPTDWVKLTDSTKGYEFMVPAGTEGKQQTENGVDVYMASVPAPYELGVMVLAFKNENASKDDLLKSATASLEALGEKDIKFEALTEINGDYSVATFTSTGKDGKKGKGKVLVATDVTDNYIVLVGGDEAKFAGNEKTMDAIWGSFAMHSGGYTGES
jgi:hypothetical protein